MLSILFNKKNISQKALKELKIYFDENGSKISKELEEENQTIVIIPIEVILSVSEANSCNEYIGFEFSKLVDDHGNSGFGVSLVK